MNNLASVLLRWCNIPLVLTQVLHNKKIIYIISNTWFFVFTVLQGSRLNSAGVSAWKGMLRTFSPFTC